LMSESQSSKATEIYQRLLRSYDIYCILSG
jgi:hypothetical protein